MGLELFTPKEAEGPQRWSGGPGQAGAGCATRVASCPPWAQRTASVPSGSREVSELCRATPLFLLQPPPRPWFTCPPSGACSLFQTRGDLRGPRVSGRPGYLLFMGWVTSGTPLPLPECCFPTHTFINFPKVLRLSGQFSQCPRRLWARLCAGDWRAGRHSPSPS